MSGALRVRLMQGNGDFLRARSGSGLRRAGVQIKDEILSSVSGEARWTDVALEEHRVMALSNGAALVTYKATARRRGERKPYLAHASSA